MKCPKCGGEMDSGQLRAESFMGGAKWLDSDSDKIVKEEIARPGPWGYVRLFGFRCESCKVLCLSYSDGSLGLGSSGSAEMAEESTTLGDRLRSHLGSSDSAEMTKE